MSEVVPVLLKDPEETLSLSVDWADVLAAGETIDGTPSWAVEDVPVGDTTPLALSAAAQLLGTIASQRVAAGTLRHVYRVRCRMTTSATQIYDRSWTVRIGTR